MSPRREQRREILLAKLAQLVPGFDPATDSALQSGPLLRTGEVALLFGVSEHCIRRWSDEGKLPCIRTLGRHRLFPARQVAEALRALNGRPAPGPHVEEAAR